MTDLKKEIKINKCEFLRIYEKKMSQGGIEPPSDPCQGSILTIILLGPSFVQKMFIIN